ncbi:MAG: acetolactate synthase 2 small subunit [Psychrobium sp.]|nr:acetolactate synthase 2 small subunit [Psychrobium sp.]
MSLHSYDIKVMLNQSPEVLERVLRVARHRGFKIELMDWKSASGELLLTVSSARQLHLLSKQLEKLFDVSSVEEL